jgi:thiol:disulfide interchange protein
MTMRHLFPAYFLFLAGARRGIPRSGGCLQADGARAGWPDVEVTYEIAKGYYLYRDKFKFAVDGEVTTLGTPQIPKGKEKDDENFGKVEVYYKASPFACRSSVPSGPLPLKLNVTSQGCADAGVCYPPQTQAVSLELPDPASAPPLQRHRLRSTATKAEKLPRR